MDVFWYVGFLYVLFMTGFSTIIAVYAVRALLSYINNLIATDQDVTSYLSSGTKLTMGPIKFGFPTTDVGKAPRPDVDPNPLTPEEKLKYGLTEESLETEFFTRTPPELVRKPERKS